MAPPLLEPLLGVLGTSYLKPKLPQSPVSSAALGGHGGSSVAVPTLLPSEPGPHRFPPDVLNGAAFAVGKHLAGRGQLGWGAGLVPMAQMPQL